MKDLMVAAYWALVGSLAASVSSLIVSVLSAFHSTVYFAGSLGLPAFVLVIPFAIGLAGALAMGLTIIYPSRERVGRAPGLRRLARRVAHLHAAARGIPDILVLLQHLFRALGRGLRVRRLRR